MTAAWAGNSRTKAEIAADVLTLARASSHLPKVTKVKIIAADSKYKLPAVSNAALQSSGCIKYNTLKRVHTPLITAAPEPKATKLSILGAPKKSCFSPRVKNWRFKKSTGSTSKNCTKTKMPGLCIMPAGTNPPAICPIFTYIKGNKNPRENQKRIFNVSACACAKACGAVFCFSAGTSYPARRTADTISAGTNLSSS